MGTINIWLDWEQVGHTPVGAVVVRADEVPRDGGRDPRPDEMGRDHPAAGGGGSESTKMGGGFSGLHSCENHWPATLKMPRSHELNFLTVNTEYD